MRRNSLLAMTMMASIQAMQKLPSALKTTGHKIAAGATPFNRRQAMNKRFRSRGVSRYKCHQGKQECARRLRFGSAAYYSSLTFIK